MLDRISLLVWEALCNPLKKIKASLRFLFRFFVFPWKGCCILIEIGVNYLSVLYKMRLVEHSIFILSQCLPRYECGEHTNRCCFHSPNFIRLPIFMQLCLTSGRRLEFATRNFDNWHEDRDWQFRYLVHLSQNKCYLPNFAEWHSSMAIVRLQSDVVTRENFSSSSSS